MIARGCFILTIFANCVLSLPVTQRRLENEDVKVMKCVVEALADVLSRPHPLPVSQDCLDTLRTDERLVSILRHRTFLRELQDIAIHGSNERAQQHDDITDGHVIKSPQTPQSTDHVADRSMLEALRGPGERSILDEKRGRERDVETKEKEGESQEEEGNEIRGTAEEEEEEMQEKDLNPDNHISDSMNEQEKGEEQEEKRDGSEEDSEEKEGKGDSVTQHKQDAESDEKSDLLERSEEKKSAEEEEEGEEGEDIEKKRSVLFSHDSTEVEKQEEEENGEVKRESGDSSKHWSGKKRGLDATSQMKRRAGEAGGREGQEEEARSPEGREEEPRSPEVTGQQEVPHYHSQEVVREDGEGKDGEERRSPEVKELQMMAERVPEERKGGEEEGSATRKIEDPEIESLAAIEFELENVAQKLHDLTRG